MVLGLPSMAYMGFTGGWRRYILVDAVPLYFMLSLACGACVYSTARSSLTATDIIWSGNRREDFFLEDPRVEEESKRYGRSLLNSVSKVKSHPEVLPFHSAMMADIIRQSGNSA